MIIFFSFVVLAAVAVWLFMQHPKFGRLPSGERLKAIQHSPHFSNGQFQNLHHTPPLAEGVSMPTVMRKFFFSSSKGRKPPVVLPSVKTNLHRLDPASNTIVWFGHSSYFIQADGKRILVDPVFSGAASPVSFTTNSFKGSDVYSADDFPEIDYLFITHDHWDHLDYDTVLRLRPRVKKIITSLGTAAHLEHWGFDAGTIIEKDWNETIHLEYGFTVHTTPGRHFSGRTFNRNKAMWTSFVLRTPTKKIFLGGDSGYDTHFAEIGKAHGPFDLAILECGQYNPYWKYIHMMPEETVQAAIDLGATRLFPVHWAKFALSLHSWDEPAKRVTAAAEKQQVPLIHPMIGQPVNLDDPGPQNKWWESVS